MKDQEMHKKMVNNGLLPSCINCIEWIKKEEMCGKYNVRPPVEIIVYGCESWDMGIPF
jgi:hypothetical protein